MWNLHIQSQKELRPKSLTPPTPQIRYVFPTLPCFSWKESLGYQQPSPWQHSCEFNLPQQFINETATMPTNLEMILSSSNHPVVSTLYSDSYAIGITVLGYSICSTNISAWLILPYLEELVSKNVLCMVCELQVGNLTLLHSSPESPHHITAKVYTLDLEANIPSSTFGLSTN